MSEEYLLLNLRNSFKKVSPPDSFIGLIEFINKLRNTNEEIDTSLTYYREKEGLRYVTNEKDYKNFLNYWSQNKYHQPTLNVEEQYKTIRKGSINVNSELESEDFDTNPKSKRDIYSKTSYNKSNLRRIYYIKEKKEMNKVEQEKRINEDMNVEKEQPIKIRKPKRKNVYKNVEDYEI